VKSQAKHGEVAIRLEGTRVKENLWFYRTKSLEKGGGEGMRCGGLVLGGKGENASHGTKTISGKKGVAKAITPKDSQDWRY